MTESEEVEIWCLTHSHWWYPHEQLQAPEGMCYCCETKKEDCDCDITEMADIEDDKLN